MRWVRGVDQWMEDNLWTRVPAKYASPHFFWFFGFICGTLFALFIMSLVQ